MYNIVIILIYKYSNDVTRPFPLLSKKKKKNTIQYNTIQNRGTTMNLLSKKKKKKIHSKQNNYVLYSLKENEKLTI